MFLNLVDYLILVLFLFFIVKSSKRGFIKEATTLLSLVLSAYLSYKFYPFIKKEIDIIVTINAISLAISYILVFLICLIVFQYLFVVIFPKGNINSSLDVFFGIVFGLLKGVVLIVLLVYFVNMILPKEKQPDIIKASSFLIMSENMLQLVDKIAGDE